MRAPATFTFEEGLEAAAKVMDEDARKHRELATHRPDMRQDALQLAEISEANARRFRAMKRGGA